MFVVLHPGNKSGGKKKIQNIIEMKDKNNKINTNFCQRLTLYLTNTLYFLAKKYTAKFPWLGAPLLFFLRIFIELGKHEAAVTIHKSWLWKLVLNVRKAFLNGNKRYAPGRLHNQLPKLINGKQTVLLGCARYSVVEFAGFAEQTYVASLVKPADRRHQVVIRNQGRFRAYSVCITQ
jgi:hypothetical protein